ncbi:hypothetical protein COV11_04925, partial [Candidatus Woesearchaeota archaeon CG10_big_fil_rev_8_21_14_0_10_30_7]
MITYSSDTNDLTFKDLRDTAKLAEKYFGTEKDPSQMPTNEKESKWIFNNLSECVNTIKYNGELIGFSFILPCNKELMDDFLSKKINEAQLYKEIKKKITY